MRVKQLKQLVESILQENEETRGDDYLLILEVLKRYVTPTMPLETVFIYHIDLKLPSFASIVRVRRKIQLENPSLEAKRGVKEIRAKEEEAWREFAKEEK